MQRLSLPDMSCGHCKASVLEALGPLATRVEVDLTSREVSVETDQPIAVLISALDQIGFPATVVSAN